MRTTLRAALAALAALLVLLSATACGSGDSKTDASKPLTIPITIKGTSISPNGTRIKASVDQKIVLDVTTDTAYEIHAHTGGAGTPIEVAKGHHRYSFSVDRPGVIEVEVEQLEKTLFQLEVTPQ